MNDTDVILILLFTVIIISEVKKNPKNLFLLAVVIPGVPP